MARKKKADAPEIEKPAPKKAKKKTYSVEEKGIILRDIFALNHEVYSIKELEKMVPKKSNGIINPMQVKEILEYCINENMVSCEKCGISNVYYCFPLLQAKTKINFLQKQKETLESLELETKELEEYIAMMDTKPEWISENEKLIELQSKKAIVDNDIQELNNELNNCDTKAMQNSLKNFKEQTNNLRDNIYSLTSFIKQKMNLYHLSDTQFLTDVGINNNDIDLLNDYEN